MLNGWVFLLYQHTLITCLQSASMLATLSFLFSFKIIKTNGKEIKKKNRGKKYKLSEQQRERSHVTGRMALHQRYATAV